MSRSHSYPLPLSLDAHTRTRAQALADALQTPYALVRVIYMSLLLLHPLLTVEGAASSHPGCGAQLSSRHPITSSNAPSDLFLPAWTAATVSIPEDRRFLYRLLPGCLNYSRGAVMLCVSSSTGCSPRLPVSQSTALVCQLAVTSRC